MCNKSRCQEEEEYMVSNLDIYDVNSLQWINNGNFLDYCQAGKYSTFNGISFVSNLKFVEKKLLPRFVNVNLVLGLSDNGRDSAGQFLNGLFKDRAEFVERANKNNIVKERILDGTLNFRFTKENDTLIHSKFYFMFNDREYQCFVGSMNLTNTALNKNHEMLIRFAGSVDDEQFIQFNKFWQKSQDWSSDYLNAKHLAGLVGKTKQQTEINVYNDSIAHLSQKLTDKDVKNVFIVGKEHMKTLRDRGINEDSLDYNKLSADDKVVIQQVAKLTGDSGTLRHGKSLANLGSEFVQIRQVVSHVLSPNNSKDSNNYLRSYEQMYPSPLMMFNEDNQILTMGKDVHHQSIIDYDEDISKEDVEIFPKIVHEYQESKLDGEGHQACDFLLWLFEAPWLWKIRQMYYYNPDSVNKSEDVPLRAVLIGVGKTGKSTLASQLGSRLTRNVNQDAVSPDAPEFKSASGSDRFATKNLNTFVTGYLQAQGPISTLVIDDAPTEYFTKDYFLRDLKGIGNKNNDPYLGPAPSVVYSTNLHDKDNNYGLSMDESVTRRCYYFGFDSKFKHGYKNAINDLLQQANNKLYLLVQQRLQELLVEQPMSSEIEHKIEQDYLYPVKKVLKEILEEYDLFDDQLAKYFAKNYDFVKDHGKTNWYSLVASQTYQKLITFMDSGETANFPKKLFDNLAGMNNRNNGAKWMQDYFNYLPEGSEISSRKSDSGFNVNVKKFDAFLGHPVLEELYQRTDVTAQTKLQGQVIGQAISDAIAKHDEELEQKRKSRGLFGWLHKK